MRTSNECAAVSRRLLTSVSRANEESILAVQIFDQKKFKKKDQGFLGVVNVRVGSILDLDVGGEGTSSFDAHLMVHVMLTTCRNDHP